MKIDTKQRGHELIRQIINDCRHYVVATAGATIVKCEIACNEYKITKHVDGKWRFGSVSAYGNHSFVYGKACDASGFVVTDRNLIVQLNAIIGVTK